jgi:hypothetical protein
MTLFMADYTRMLDSTIVRAHQQAATGRKKGARTRLWGVPEEV